MTAHIKKLSSIADQLRELGQPLDEMKFVTEALATLPEKFRIVRSVWANVPLNERTIDNLLQGLCSEENVLKSYERNDNSSRTAFAAHSYNSTRENHHSKGGGFSGVIRNRFSHRTQDGFINRYSSREGPRCSYCFIVGHETHECRKKRRAEQDRKTNEPHCGYCLIPGHETRDCRKK